MSQTDPTIPITPPTFDKQNWAERIQAKALELGFDRVGILSVKQLQQNGAFDQHVEKLRQWLDNGYQAEMEWMETHFDKRAQPDSLMDNTKSIICVAMNYFNPDAYEATNDKALKIAKYARGNDYHDVIKQRLKTLLAWIQEQDKTIQGRALTDSAPILEKPLAQMAGIGWQGKNGNVISPGIGSFLFLGELLLSLELEPDKARTLPSCGNCTRCIDACPTDAIQYDATHYGVINANRCISYWTIEYKGERFPEEIQKNLKGWIFGCDICQDVCPWNIRFAAPTTEPLFQPRPWNIKPESKTLLALDEETFREHYRKSPIKRAKLAGLKRNVQATL